MKTEGPRERILVYGSEGVGKSRTFWTIGKKLRETASPGMVWVVDLDVASDRMATGFSGYDANMEIRSPADYKELLEGLEYVMRKGGRDDWLAVDGLGEAWSMCKDYVTDKAFGKDLSTWLIDDLAGGKKDYGRTPDAQNKCWRMIARVLTRFPGHVVGCTPAKKLFVDKEGGVNKNLSVYEGTGHSPDGQNTLGHLFHTILYLNKAGQRYLATSVKDRERGLVNNKIVVDFPTSYLKDVAGWML